MSNPVASLSIRGGRIVFTSRSFTANEPVRPAMVLVIGTQGEIRIATKKASYTGRILLVAPNVCRSIDADNAGLYSIQLDPASQICHYLRGRVLGEESIIDLSNRADAFVMRTAGAALNLLQSCEEVCTGSQRILDTLFPEAAKSQSMDPRVHTVASWLWTHVPVRTDPQFLAHLCELSESRLAHLFSASTGNSIREYLLWIKMRKAASMFAEGLTLTEVAYVIGFADLAHLSRTFKKYFDLPPSFLTNPHLVRMQIQ